MELSGTQNIGRSERHVALTAGVWSCANCLVRLADRAITFSMSLSARDIERLSIAVVHRLAQERRSRNMRWLKWSIAILSLVFAAAALVLELL